MDWHAYVLTNAQIAALFDSNPNGWRPPQWSGLSNDAAQLVYIKTNIAGYFFDAVLRMDHESTLRITEHPIQTGAPLTDHSFMLSARLIMEIGFSDCMDSLVQGQYSGAEGKSVSAYQILLKLQAYRQPLTVVTRLKTYRNMLIQNLTSPDDVRTAFGLKCTITLRQIMLATVQTTTAVSSKSSMTNSKEKGEVPTSSAFDEPTVASKINDYIFGPSTK